MAHVAEKWELIPPTEENHYCAFSTELEDDPLVLFHITAKGNLDPILSNGFCSAKELGSGNLPSVSYAKRSTGCFAHIKIPTVEDFVIFAVKFDTLDQKGIANNTSDIHVYRKDLQPTILGYCEVPRGFTYK